jgi:hypothetical protein
MDMDGQLREIMLGRQWDDELGEKQAFVENWARNFFSRRQERQQNRKKKKNQ